MTEPTGTSTTQDELFKAATAATAGLDGVNVAKIGTREVAIAYPGGFKGGPVTLSITQPEEELQTELREIVRAITIAKNVAIQGAAPPAPVAARPGAGASPTAAAAGAAMAQGQTPVVEALGQLAQNFLYGAASAAMKASSRTRNGNVQGLLIRTAETALGLADDLRGKTTAKAQAAQAREVQSVAKAFAAGIPRLAPNELGVVMKSRNIDRQKGFRGRTGTPFANDRGLNPPTYIEIAQMPADVQGTTDLKTVKALGMKYNDFFITDTQEMDAEKADVSETFGAPHVFATGRYMRKVVIQGVCRTGAVNVDVLSTGQSNAALSAMTERDKARYVVPHTLGLRVLYDRVLRASEQISRSLFSRLVVDGEVYCGWFTTLNVTRSGADEGFAHFTMSMLVFARYHKDEDWAAKLLQTDSLPAKNAFDDAAASATLASMVGKMTLKVTPGTVSIGSVLSEGAKEPLIFKPTAKLEASGVAQPVSTETTLITRDESLPLPGLALYFGNSSADRSPLNGSTVSTGSFDLVPVVTDFAALRDAVASFLPGTTAGLLNARVNIRIKPTMGEEIISLGVTLQINTIQTPEAKNLTVRLNDSTDDKPATSSHPAKEVFESNTTSKITARFNIFKANGSPLDVTNALTGGAVVTLMHPTKPTDRSADGPMLTAKTGTIGAVEDADVQAAAKSGAARVSVSTTIVPIEPQQGLVGVITTFDYAQLAGVSNLREANPFVSAKDLETSFRYKIQLQGFNEFITPVVSVTAQYQATWISRIIQKITAAKAGEMKLSGARPIIELTFSLHPDVAGLFTAGKTEAVKQAINQIVSGSTFDIQSGDQTLVIFNRQTTYELSSAKVVELTATEATVAVPSASDSGRVDLASLVSTQLTLTMSAPAGIIPIVPLLVQK